MKVAGIECAKCGCVIYSRSTHDMHRCECKEVAIDGGRDYLRITGEVGSFMQVTVTIDATEEEMYNDWNKNTDELGVIKKENKGSYDIEYAKELDVDKIEGEGGVMYDMPDNCSIEGGGANGIMNIEDGMDKKEIVEVICGCGAVVLRADMTNGGVILNGTLTCAGCGKVVVRIRKEKE